MHHFTVKCTMVNRRRKLARAHTPRVPWYHHVPLGTSVAKSTAASATNAAAPSSRHAQGLEVGAVAGIVAGAAVVIILLVVRIILFYKKKPAASPTAVPVMQGVAMPEATPAPTTVMPVATPVQATYA